MSRIEFQLPARKFSVDVEQAAVIAEQFGEWLDRQGFRLQGVDGDERSYGELAAGFVEEWESE